MARRGINMVGYFEKGAINAVRKCKPGAGKGCWVRNKLVDREQTGEPSVLWQHLMSNTMSKESLVKVLTKDRRTQLRRIDTFESNGQSVNVSDIYPFNGYCYCLFMDDGKGLTLFEVASKTMKELKLARYDKEGNSTIPLLIGVDRDKTSVTILNTI